MPSPRISFSSLLLAIMLLLGSCTKTEEVYIPDNTPPPDYTISDVKVENYINKVYISLLGREATEAELETGMTSLKLNGLSAADRMTFLATVMSDSAYSQGIIDYSANLLIRQYIDSNQNNGYIYQYTQYLSNPQYNDFHDEIYHEIARFQQLNDLEPEFLAGTIGLPEVHRRLVNSMYYDDINMGTTNFVISCYETFLFRSPTSSELTQGENMVNGFYGQVFLEDGRSKDEFLAIFFASDAYYEGQVRDLFQRYLFREPTSEENAYYTARYAGNDNYKELQATILSLNEYVGL